MTKRKAISKTIRFEVFKRDRFTCQYCGAKAPDVVLHVDHIQPVAGGGGNEIMNLVAACADCNGGKGARRLDDGSAVERQRAQIEELQHRREQLEMMLKWRDEAEAHRLDVVEQIGNRIAERGGFVPNENGNQDIRKWLKRFSLAELLEALDESFDHYMKWAADEPLKDAWHEAFRKIPAIASLRRQAVAKPYMPKLAYIQGILRRRCKEPYANFIREGLEDMHVKWGIPLAALEGAAKEADDFSEYWDAMVMLARELKDGED